MKQLQEPKFKGEVRRGANAPPPSNDVPGGGGSDSPPQYGRKNPSKKSIWNKIPSKIFSLYFSENCTIYAALSLYSDKQHDMPKKFIANPILEQKILFPLNDFAKLGLWHLPIQRLKRFLRLSGLKLLLKFFENKALKLILMYLY